MKICFFCKISDKKKLFLVEFYHQDIEILRKLDPDLTIATKYSEIDWQADLIFVWWWTYAFFPIVVAKLLRKKVIVTGTFNYRCPQAHSDYFRRPYWQRVLIKGATKLANCNVFVSLNEFNQIKHDWRYDNCAYSPHGVDTDHYLNSSDVKDKDLFTICWTGRENIKRKCLIEIIDAIEVLKRQNKRVHLNIAGHQGEAFEYVKTYIDNKGLKDEITLLGEIPEDRKLYYLSHCACYLQPSKYEGFGLAIAEAMSCGAAVITTAVGEVPNVVGEEGIIIENTTPQCIASAIDGLQKKDVKVIGEKARQRIQTCFSIKRREAELLDIVKKVMER